MREPTPWPESEINAESRWMDSGPRGGDDYGRLLATQRLLQDRLAAAALPVDVSRAVTAKLAELAETVGAYAVPEQQRRDGRRPDLPGRGMALMPPYVIDEDGDGRIAGRVTFTRAFLGGNHAAHGGAPPLLFDDVLGRALNDGLPGVARTAYLNIDYRRVTPLDVELRFEAARDRVEGRKRFGSARLLDDAGLVLAECTALFVRLQSGQP